ncbi:phosphatidylinositol mannoside acyltransferase [Demequina aurantiaca]|uniref:phosphatidylinositol mannoside acyltransferase n=1 Tax=Demequina aurantiaca TaxID=676200 RepID=UPI000782D0D2|nr:phosphatidylinositol mannoside acyltransferase [Demequina aurantiaca]
MNAFLIAWRASRYLPVSVVRGLASLGAASAWFLRGKSVTRLESNLHKVTGLSGKPLRRLSRRGMSSVANYYAEVLELPRMSGDVIDARVRMENEHEVQAILRDEGRVVLPLSHSGNWDLIGAYAGRNIAHVTSVAEVLNPPEVFEEFIKFRAGLGMTIFGHEGQSTFRKLITQAKTVGGALALVADRDLSGSGIHVDMWGHDVRVAPGPAALAVASGSALIPVMVYSEPLTGARRKAAKSRVGKVLKFGPTIRIPEGRKTDQVQSMTESWVAFISTEIAAHPEDWHMLQRFGWTE